MKGHLRTYHQGISQVGNVRKCHAALLSKNRSGLQQQAFEVVDRENGGVPQVAHERLISAILAQAKEQAPSLQAVVPSANERAIDLFHSRYGWNKLLHHCDVTKVVALASLPRTFDKLWSVRCAVEAYFDSVCKNAIPDLTILLRRHLNTAKK